jgi:chaperone required for assembly of F1-ATPase
MTKTAPLHTPKKNPLDIPNSALARAVAEEWAGGGRYSPKTMPLTAITYTALDVVAENHAKVVEALLAYGETDLLLYRSETPELKARQAAAWDEVLNWAVSRFGCTLEVTEGVMPLTQPVESLAALRAHMERMNTFYLSAFSVLAQSLSSLLLALAVAEGRLDAEQAFLLSRLDEEYQAEKWGEDSLSLARMAEINRDVQAASRFLNLLKS